MITPFLVIYLSNNLHLALWQVGTILSVNLLCSRLLPLGTGLLGDRLNHSTNVIIGIALRGGALLGYLFTSTFFPLLLIAFLTGTGMAFYAPSVRAVLATQPERWKTHAFLRLNQALNAGAVVGPLCGGVLVTLGITFPFLCSGLLLLGLAAFLFLFRRQYATTYQAPDKIMENVRATFHQKPFIFLVLTMFLFFMIFAQFSLYLPPYIFSLYKSDFIVSTLFLVNGLIGVLLIFPLGWIFRKYPSLQITRVGVLCTGLGLACIPFFSSLLWLYVCTALFTLGETLAFPGSDMLVAHFSSGENPGMFYGMFSVGWAIGGTIGNYLGSWLLSQNNQVLPWVIYGVTGLLAYLLLARLKIGETVSSPITSVINKKEGAP